MNRTTVEEISVKELIALREQKADVLVLDVREQQEYDEFNMGGTLIPIGQLPDRLNELNRDQLLVVHCKSGGRSRRAVEYLNAQGFTQAKNLKGGITAYREEIKS